jgi:hypothetical protein
LEATQSHPKTTLVNPIAEVIESPKLAIPLSSSTSTTSTFSTWKDPAPDIRGRVHWRE